MPGRNDPCPCGSGRKYKKCCLRKDENLNRRKAVVEETFAFFKEAAIVLERKAVQELGYQTMDQWALPYMGDDLQLEAHTFQEFSVCHIPFQGYPSLARWAESRITLEPGPREVLDIALETPYSIWQILEITGDGCFLVKNLLTLAERTVLPIEELLSDVGNVFYGKVIERHKQFQILCYSPVFMLPEAARDIIRQALGTESRLTDEQLLEPATATRLYLGWWEEVRQRKGPEKDSSGGQVTYSYDIRREAWLTQALINSPDFATGNNTYFVFPATGPPKAFLLVADGLLQANCDRASSLLPLQTALERACGSLLTLRPQDTDLPSSDLDDETTAPSLEELLEDFIEERAATVSPTTLNRDLEALDLLRIYLVGMDDDIELTFSGDKVVVHSDYDLLLSALPGFAEYLPKCRLVKSKTQLKAFQTSFKVLLKWLAGRDLVDTEERDALLQTIDAGGAPKGPQTYHLRLSLRGNEPPVWRDIRVPGRYRLDQLHKMIQLLFGWADYHLHEFEIGGKRYTDLETLEPEYDQGEEDEKVPLTQALGFRASFLYRYDFGDNWRVQGKVLKMTAGDLDAPECLDGAGAGPPEDCGGTPGFMELKRILANPKDSDYEETRLWAGPAYDPNKFDAPSMAGKLARKFGRRAPKAKAPEGSELAGFRLSKMNVLAAIVAALKEESPRTVEQVHQRLTELDYPLKAGVESLKRALAKADYVRTRLDDALELVPGEALERALRWMEYSSQEGLPKEKPPEIQVTQPTGPITREELNRASKYGKFPPNLSLRRRLILMLDVLGGEATLRKTLDELNASDRRIEWTEDEALRTLKGSPAVELADNNLKLVYASSDIQKARDVFRKWLHPYLKAEAERAQREEESEARQAKRAESIRDERKRLSQLKRAVVYANWDPERFALALRWVESGELAWYTKPSQAREALFDAGVVIGLDPRTGFERMGWEFGDKLVVDITPSFKSMTTVHGKRKPLSTSKAIAMVTGRGITDQEKIAEWAARGQESKVRKALQNDLEQLHAYWRFGLVHHAVLRGDEWMPVNWNTTREVTLRYAIDWSLEDEVTFNLQTAECRGAFLPRKVNWRALHGQENLLHGVWQHDGRSAVIPFRDIIDCEYPYEPSVERLERVFW